MIRRIRALLRPHTGRLALAVSAGAATEIAALGLMGTAAWLIARAAEQPPLAALSLAIVAVRGFAVARGVFRYGERLASHDVALRALATLRGRVYDALVPLAPSGTPAFRGPDLLSRMVGDVEAVQDLVVRVLVPVATAGVVAAVAVSFGAVVLPAAGAVLAIGLLVAGVLVPMLAAVLSRRTARRLAPARAELAARVVDVVDGSADLAVFGAAGEALADADDAAARLARLERRSALASSGAGAAALLVQAGTVVAVAVLAVSAAETATISPVMVPVVALVALIAFEPMFPLVPAARHYLEARAAMGRVLAVIDTPTPVAEPSRPAPAPAPSEVNSAGIEVSGLAVRYTPDRPPALYDVDLRLGPGRSVAVVGASGSGKSTLLAALMRFAEPEAGTVAVGGTDVRELAGDDVRRVITGVTQDAHLFNTTVRENLRLAAPEADDDVLRTALARAKVLDWVETLPKGLDTVVGAAGALVSGGQRQRIALARAILARPPVLVLDEPTEGLDPETADALVTDVFAAAGEQQGILLVTHRLDGLDAADEIVVLEAGRVVQRGCHRDLVRVPGAYHDLWWASRPSAVS